MNTDSKFSGKLIVIVGPTASGKTSISIELARYFGTQIISADSRQFYKEIPIGTAAPTIIEQKKIKHYFVGNLSVTDNYNVSKFENDVLELLDNELMGTPIVIMTGGSGLYLDAVCKGIDDLPDIDETIRAETKQLFEVHGIEALEQKLWSLDPEYYLQVDHNNPVRLMRAIEVCLQTGHKYSELRKNAPLHRNFEIIKIGIDIPRETLVSRINDRTDVMIGKGWVEEAKSVHKYKNHNSLNTVGYKELFAYFNGEMTLELAVEKIKTNTRRYAKRQMTWFRKDKEINWFDGNDLPGMIRLIEGD
ncbi:MAG: tRNA (adenosine(37)-N6)-dimethylallyltransferase MiaA [Bacteroidetes bacterium]|nr:tRNA (adenosine(37)-N6)-dimethylallyltransferase MiaA [Bacteroidota bacterium]